MIVPEPGHKSVVEKLHAGIKAYRKKSLARGFVWWPKLNTDLQM